MLFMKKAKVFNKNVLFDLASLLVSFIVLGPVITSVNDSVFQNKDNFLETIFKTQISEYFPQYSVEVEKIELTPFLSSTPLEIKIHDLRLIGPKAHINITESRFKFALKSVFSPGIPQSISLKGAKVTLNNISKNSQNTYLDIVDNSELLSEIFAQTPRIKSILGLPQKIDINLDELSVFEKKNPKLNKILIKDLNFNISQLGQNNLEALLSLKTFANGRIDASLQADISDLSWKATTNLQSINTRPFRDYLPKYFQEILTECIFSGELNTEFEASKLISIDGHFDSEKIILNTRFEEHLNVNQFSGWFDYDASKKRAEFTNLVLDFAPEFKLKAAIQLENIGGTDTLITANAETRDTPLKNVLPFLSTKPLLPINNIFSDHTSGGVFDFASFKIMGIKKANSDKVDWQEFHVDGQVSDLGIAATNNQYKLLKANTKNVFSANLNRDEQKSKLFLSSTISDGLVELKDSGRVIENISGKLDFSFNGKTIQNASIKLLQPQIGELLFTAKLPSTHEAITLFGEISNKQFKQYVSKTKDPVPAILALETEKFNADALLQLWPEQIAMSARKWLLKRGSGGEFRNVKLRAFVGFPKIDSSRVYPQTFEKPFFAGLSGNWGWHNMNFTWKDKSPIIRSVDLEARIFENRLSIEILSASMPELKMKNGQIELFPIFGYGKASIKRDVEIEATIDGTISAFRELLDDPTVNRLPIELKKLTNPSGTIVTKITTRSALQQGKLKLNTISAVASLSSASFGNLPLDEKLTDGNIELTLEEDGRLLFNGIGKISGVESSFNGKQTADKKMNVVIITTPSKYLSEQIGEFTKIDISGNTAMRLHLDYDSINKIGGGSAKVDLTDAAIDLPMFNWAKIPGENGEVDASFYFKSSSVHKIEIDEAIIGTLQGRGVFEVASDLSISDATVTDFKSPGYDIDKLVININDDKTIEVLAEGGLIDTTFLRRTKGITENREISFDFTSARLQLAKDITLQGKLIGNINKLGSGTAILNGTLLLEQSPLIEEATIEASFNEYFETLSGTGLIGGVEANLSYESLSNATSQLLVRSQNAGRTLIGLDILDTIRGGELILRNVYRNNNFDNFETEIKVTDFSVVEAPKSIRALSVLSLTGLYSLIEGDGTKFDVGVANIETIGDRRILKNVKASGEAVKFELAGEYDRETDELQVRGLLAPLSLISDIIGVIPLVSNIITGQDKKGLLATQFEMSGKLADPVITINPASVLAPGVIRNILSPGWLTRESGIRIDSQK